MFACVRLISSAMYMYAYLFPYALVRVGVREVDLHWKCLRDFYVITYAYTYIHIYIIYKYIYVYIYTMWHFCVPP